jgi:type IV pilus assembly protein PilA
MLEKQDGFTILELMNVIALIGTLSAIAIPAYTKYLARSRQTEARLELGGAFIIEKGYVVENGTYTACLNQAGFAPTLNANRFYSVGIATIPAGLCGPISGLDCQRWFWTGAAVTCSAATDALFSGNVTATPGALIYGPGAPFEACVNGTNVTEATFTIGACGNVSTTAVIYDGWTIDDQKVLTNQLNGT